MFKVRNSKWFVAGLILTGTLGLGGARIAAADDNSSSGILSKTALSDGSNYCHLQFPAMRPSTLTSDRPQLKSANTGDIVDFYGPCDHDPTGKEEVLSQLHGRALVTDRGNTR